MKRSANWGGMGSLRSMAGLCLLSFWMLTACTPAWKKPVPVDQHDFLTRSISQTQNDVTVTVAVPDRQETLELFGTSLYSDRIQPVWIRIENPTEQPLVMLKAGVDPDHFSPLEASYQRHSGSKETRREMDLFFHGMGFENPILAGESRAGFVFTNLDEGYKVVNMDLVASDALLNYSFIIEVPGLVVDFKQVDFDRVFDEFIELEHESELIEALESLPCCTTNKKGERNGDPLNIVFIGQRAEMLSALVRRGWHQTEITHGRSAWRTVKSFLFGTRYRYSPISPLYVFGRQQDMGMQKARDTIHLRNHMRVWRTPYIFRGDEVYIGQISRDVGVKFNPRTITTHAIDPDVDDTREALVSDLAYSQALVAWGYVGGSQVSTLDDTYYNLTPDPYYSDGLRVVMFFGPKPTKLNEIELLQWSENKAMKMLQGER